MTDRQASTKGDVVSLFGRARIENDPEIRKPAGRDLGQAASGSPRLPPWPI